MLFMLPYMLPNTVHHQRYAPLLFIATLILTRGCLRCLICHDAAYVDAFAFDAGYADSALCHDAALLYAFRHCLRHAFDTPPLMIFRF